MRKQTLLTSTVRLGGFTFRGALNPRTGLPMRGDDRSGVNDSSGGSDNGGGNGGNSGSDNNAGGNQNNTGNEFDAGAFWNGPAEETPNASGNGGSAGGGNPSQGTNDSQNEGNAFATMLGGLNFGNGVFTPEAVEAMNAGNPETFNTNMTTFGREVTRQAVLMAAQLMQRNNAQLEERFGEMMDGRFGQQATEADLAKAIPSYIKPGMKPIVDGIMAQALKLTRGKRPEAIEMTKSMLQFQATQLGADFGINTPPGGADDIGTPTNWEEELLGR